MGNHPHGVHKLEMRMLLGVGGVVGWQASVGIAGADDKARDGETKTSLFVCSVLRRQASCSGKNPRKECLETLDGATESHLQKGICI